MQAGDLADGPLADILRTLGAAGATGAVHVTQRDAAPDAPETTRDGVLYLKDGRLYAATSPGPRPLLGVRLVAAGAVTREALEEALESQAGELAGWRLGELLVHLGYVDADIVTEFVIEQILDTVAEISSWPAGSWRFRRGEKTRESDDLSLDIADVLEQVAERLSHWSNLAAWGSKAEAVPVRVSYDENLAAEQMPLAQTLLREIDGRRTLVELAVRCGLTTFEAGQVLALLVDTGAVLVKETTDGVGRAAAVTAAAQLAPEPVEPAAMAMVIAPEPEAAPPVPAAPTVDDDLSALLGAGEEDLGVQLAVLARQAEEARFAAEQRRHAELLAGRHRPASAPEPDPAPAERRVNLALPEREAVPYEQILVAPAEDAVAPLTVVPDPEPVAADPVPVEPVALAPIGLEPLAVEPVAAEPVPSVGVEGWDVSAVAEPIAVEGWEAPAVAAAAPPVVEPLAPPVVEPVALVPPLPAAPPAWTEPATEPAAERATERATAPAVLPVAAEMPEVPEAYEPATVDADQRAAMHAALAEVAAAQAALAPEPAEVQVDLSTPPLSPEPARTDFAPASFAAPGGHDDYAPAGESPFADTASLLRELSSLGLDDVPPPAPAPRAPAPRSGGPVAAPPAKAKRKSIFGR